VQLLYNVLSIYGNSNCSLKNQSNIHKDKTKTFSQWLSVFLCAFWLISSLTTITHAQEHAVIEEHNCQLCLANENTASEKILSRFFLPFVPQLDTITKRISPHSIQFFHFYLGNRDPPYHR